MTNSDFLTQTTGKTGRYNPFFRELGLGMIRVMCDAGHDLILLEDLYRRLEISDKSSSAANGVQYSVFDAKEMGLIENTELRACYKVIADA